MMQSIKRMPIFFVVSVAMFLILIASSICYMRSQLIGTYRSAIEDIDNQSYQSAIEKLTELGDYKKSLEYLSEAYYRQAIAYFENGEFEASRKVFSDLDDYKYSSKYALILENLIKIQKNSALLNSEDRTAYNLYISQLDALMQEDDVDDQKCRELIQSINDISTRMDSRESMEQSYQEAIRLFIAKAYSNALPIFLELGDYGDSCQLAEDCSKEIQRLRNSHTISAGIQFSSGITEGGQVLLSGQNFAGANVMETWSGILSVSACNEFLVGLQENGTVCVAKRKNLYSYRIDTSDWSDIIDVAAGEQFVVGLRADGTVVAQGIDGYGETDVGTWRNIISIDTGWQHTVGLDQAGNVHITGYNSDFLLKEIANADDWTNIVRISTGGSSGRGNLGGGHVVALKEDGHVVAIGDNSCGQCNVSEWADIIAISAGDYHTVGLKADGTVVTTQSPEAYPDSYSEISTWENIVAISAGYGFTLGLKMDGTVVAAGNSRQGQTDIQGWTEIAVREEWYSDLNDPAQSEQVK